MMRNRKVVSERTPG